MRRFANFLRESHGGVLEIGRHRGAFFDEMLANPGYCEWAMDLSAPSTSLHEFAEYVRRELRDGDDGDTSTSETIDYSEDIPPKKARLETPAGLSEECKICFEKVIHTCFVPCGHMCACVLCAFKVQRCPICRTNIHQVVETFAA